MAEEIIINNKCFIASQTDLKEYMDNMTEEIKVIPTNGTSADDVKYAKRVEEIYIDGVDVAGCSLYLKDNGKCLRLLTDNEPETECNAICDYGCLHHKEQLKRLEQERDELKFENDRYKQLLKGCPTEDEDCGLCVIDEQNKRLKQENKELKEYSKRMENQRENYYEEYNKYRSALEEIKKILTDEYYIDTVKAIHKINEVLNEP